MKRFYSVAVFFIIIFGVLCLFLLPKTPAPSIPSSGTHGAAQLKSYPVRERFPNGSDSGMYLQDGNLVPDWITVDNTYKDGDFKYYGRDISLDEINSFLHGAFAFTLPASTRKKDGVYYQMDLADVPGIVHRLYQLTRNFYAQRERTPLEKEFSKIEDFKSDLWAEMYMKAPLSEKDELSWTKEGKPWKARTETFHAVPQIYGAPSPIYHIRIDPNTGICHFMWISSHND